MSLYMRVTFIFLEEGNVNMVFTPMIYIEQMLHLARYSQIVTIESYGNINLG